MAYLDISAATGKPTKCRKRFLQGLYPREKWLPSEWAERCRQLSTEESSEPGPYLFDRTPYWRFVCDLVERPGIEEIVCLKGAQIGWSEACRNILGYWIDMKPDQCLVLMPDQMSAQAFRNERMEPLMRHTPAIARYVSPRAWDTKKTSIRFENHMRVFFMWAGSKSGTKSRPIRYLICEEPDEYPSFSSTGGDPLSKAEKRLTTYRDKGLARILLGGTPSNRLGNTWKRWEMCAVRYQLWCPCPHCNTYQLLEWKQVKFDPAKDGEIRSKHAERIKSGGLAWYECSNCRAQIHDWHKPRMLQRGRWASEDQAVTLDGRIVGPETKARRVGVKISGLYSPWVTFPQLASEWLESQNDPQALADFVNQRLAEPFEEQRSKTAPDFIREKAKGAPPPLRVPEWARMLIATADTQGTDEQSGYFWYVIRAWGYDYRSQLIDFGVAHSKDELVERCLTRRIPLAPGGAVSPQLLAVDSGGPRWSEVYQLATRDKRIHPAKGASWGRTWMVTERPQKRHGVVLWEIDTEQSKDLLHRLIHSPDKTQWLPHNEINDDYCSQMCSESKIFNPREKREEWAEIVKNNNHIWDCEHMQCAVAWRLGMGVAEPEKPEVNPQDGEVFNPIMSHRGRW